MTGCSRSTGTERSFWTPAVPRAWTRAGDICAGRPLLRDATATGTILAMPPRLDTEGEPLLPDSSCCRAPPAERCRYGDGIRLAMTSQLNPVADVSRAGVAG